ncbi:MAG: N-acetyl-gamma-glutamyl-phosphate reductase [Firmicutes bacterium]|nr:N-acetyl-gamma-glutamyl-phosphate reductase [Bacillota bacterium]MCL5040401.1 N-acetyl-gamma-glutamyl-phosphate reductase [Bacillota bacterium]
MIKASVIGATGYAGVELVRILGQHPAVQLVALTTESYKDQKMSAVFPHLVHGVEMTALELDLVAVVEKSDVVFTSLPHALAMSIVPAVVAGGKKIIDLGADYRLKDATVYGAWYKHQHTDLENLAQAVYGLPELHRAQIRGRKVVGNPGCYPTSVALGVAPLGRADWVDWDSLIIDSKSGVSGAGRGLSLGVHFSEVNENLKAYNIAGTHRHTPEIEQEISGLAGRPIKVSFTPHLIPMTRGILSTMYFSIKSGVGVKEVYEAYQAFYSQEPFVNVLEPGQLPQTKHVYGSNYCQIGLAVDQRTNRLLVVSVIDNLVKGAAGQAVQNMNLLFDLEETVGLRTLPIFP